MHEHTPIARHCDVAVVGGSAAGLAAALQLGRQRRSVIVIDSGEPRNAPAAHMHGYLGFEGRPPADLIEVGREEVRSYGGEILSGRVTNVARLDDGRFRVDLEGDEAIVARRVLAATGLVDELPDVEGLAEHWGAGVIHCPFCHGYEVRDQRIVLIVAGPMGLHPAGLWRQLTDRLTVVLHDSVDVDDAELDALRANGVEIVDERATRIVTDDNGRVVGVELAEHDRIDADAVAVSSSFRVRAEPFTSLGLQPEAHPSGRGDFVETDFTGATAIPGLYAAGNITDPSHQVLQAAAQGSRVGAMISFDLAGEDMAAAARPLGNESDWEHRYSGEPMWSGNPNGSLVAEAGHLTPGRALDVGAGEGGDAVWLAEQGWTVTASDISSRALARVAAEAERRGLTVECRHADANSLGPYPPESFDLVSAQYASIPRTPDHRGVRNVLEAVAPGGTLLVVSHDLDSAAGDHNHAFDPDSYLRVGDFVNALKETPGWEIEINETRPRPAGAASAPRHVNDIVLRARRT